MISPSQPFTPAHSNTDISQAPATPSQVLLTAPTSPSSENVLDYEYIHNTLRSSTLTQNHNYTTKPNDNESNSFTSTSEAKLPLVPHEVISYPATAQKYQIAQTLECRDHGAEEGDDDGFKRGSGKGEEEELFGLEFERGGRHRGAEEEVEAEECSRDIGRVRRSKGERIEQIPTTRPPSERIQQGVVTPTRPRHTPLKQRFLREVTMSPQSRPQTPVTFGTPGRRGRMSPLKGEKSPDKSPDKGKENNGSRANSRAGGRESPTKHHLEVGQNGFYYSCEIPVSKVVTKNDTLKMKTTVEMKGTPKTKDMNTPKSDTINNTSNDPRSTTTPSKLRGPGTPVRHRLPPHLAGSTKKTDSSKKTSKGTPGSRNIGDMMAGLNFRDLSSEASPIVSGGDGKISAPPTPLRKAAERSGISSSVQGMMRKFQDSDVVKNAGMSTPMIDNDHEEQDFEVVRSSLPSEDETILIDVALMPDPSPIKHTSRRTLKRVGTDPAVLLAMKDEMAQMETRLRRSLSTSNDPSIISKTSPAIPTQNLTPTSQKPALPRTNTEPNLRPAVKRQGSTPKLKPKQHLLKSSFTHLRTPPPRPRNPTPLSTPAKIRLEGSTTTTQSAKKISSTPITKPVPSTPRSVKLPSSVPAYMRPTLSSSAAFQGNDGSRTPTTPRTPNSITRPVAKPIKTASPALKTPRSVTKPAARVSKPTSTLPKPRTSMTEKALQKKEFVGAPEIAKRVRKWNYEERTGDGPGSPVTRRMNTRSPAKPAAPAKTKITKSSDTPPGSPHNPKTSPLFPYPQKPATQHTAMKKINSPRTPLPSKQVSKIARYDRNAFRTPSKEIEGSLDEAIDRKIEEDRRGGGGKC